MISFGGEISVNLDFNKDPGSYFEFFDVNGDKMADLTSHDGNGNIAIVERHTGTNIFQHLVHRGKFAQDKHFYNTHSAQEAALNDKVTTHRRLIPNKERPMFVKLHTTLANTNLNVFM